MGIGSYIKLVEIQTKVASVLPFFGGTLYAAYRFGSLDTPNLLLMAGSLLSLDMATTTLNNYMDYKKARKKSGYGYEVHNAIVRDGLKESRVVFILIVLAALSLALGLILALRTSWPVLALGSLSFLVAIAYSAGPLPLSRTPLGEFFSGSFMGLVIPFTSIIIHSGFEPYFSLDLSASRLLFTVEWKESLAFLLLFAPLATGIANIMLANNICDLEDDRENARATLPILLGTKNALILWIALLALGFLSVLAGAASGLFSRWLLFFPLAALAVLPKAIAFVRRPEKATTFVYAVQIFVIQAVFLCILLGAGLLATR